MKPIEPSCKHLKSQLSEFLDGELDEAVCREIQEHLANCENCRVMVDTLRKTIVLYQIAPRETVPSKMHARLVEVLDIEEMKNRAKRKGME
jgi:predicted anti-sigma-YlaC factor YlaD